MSAHTPGPWVVQGRDQTEVMGPDFLIVKVPFDAGSPVTDTEGLEAAQADARLIAAAPDLLSACELALRSLEGVPADFAVRACGEIRTAIAKANGT